MLQVGSALPLARFLFPCSSCFRTKDSPKAEQTGSIGPEQHYDYSVPDLSSLADTQIGDLTSPALPQPLSYAPPQRADIDALLAMRQTFQFTTTRPPNTVTERHVDSQSVPAHPSTVSEQLHQSEPLEGHDYFRHVDEHRIKFVGASSSQVFVKRLDQESSSGSNLSDHLSPGMTFSEEFVFPGLDVPTIPLPDDPYMTTFVEAYFRHYQCLFPFLDKERFLAANRAIRTGTPSEEFPMPLHYLVISLGADNSSGNRRLTDTGHRYLQAAWKALPSLLGRPYRSTVQTLLLMVLALRAVSKLCHFGSNA